MTTTITKEFDIAQPMDVVWKSLANPEDIVTCVPGASITEKIDDRNYKGAVVTKFGPIKASYAGDIEILELDEENWKMVLKGKGLDSKGKGSADMDMVGQLSEVDGKTHVDFKMDIKIVGTLAQFGSRLINDVSDQLLNTFVQNFQNKLASAAPAAAATAGSGGGATATAEAPKTAPAAPPADNSLNATSLIGTVLKSIFGSILDLFRGKKS